MNAFGMIVNGRSIDILGIALPIRTSKMDLNMSSSTKAVMRMLFGLPIGNTQTI